MLYASPVASNTRIVCDDCGESYGISEWPYCPHGLPSYRVDAYSEPVFDISLGETVSSNRDRERIARRLNLVEKNPPADTPARRADIRDRQMAKRAIYGARP